MISILIPVYNFDVTQLVSDLQHQAIDAGIGYEIILIDDASEKIFRDINSNLASDGQIKYFEESENIGRSKIRNKLASLAAYPYLLFMDCDSRVPGNNYLQNYLKHCNGNIVICGGRVYETEKPREQDLLLRWKQGKSREEFTAEERSKSPNKSFMTNNFLISGSLFNQIKFSEEIEGYGHEDTLFGYELAKNNITIIHIDNPLIHIGLETNKLFLEKTKESIRNLNNILSLNRYEKMLVKTVRLLSWFRFLKNNGLHKPVCLLFNFLKRLFERNLLGKKPSLMIFDFYKLGYLCKIHQNNHFAS